MSVLFRPFDWMSEKLIAAFSRTCFFWGGLAFLTWEMLKSLFQNPVSTRLITEQVYQAGVRSVSLVMITAASTGIVMTFQFGIGLEKFGGEIYVPKIVSLSIVRELGPVFAALMVAARIGAGFTSEIGSMKVTQQLDALRALGASPIQRVVIPRVLAVLIALPLLTALANGVGILSGMVLGSGELGLTMNFFFTKVIETIWLKDYLSGFTKSFVFAYGIGIISCYYGLNVKEGTSAIGRATTKAVVMSSIFVVITDVLMTKFFWVFEKWVL